MIRKLTTHLQEKYETKWLSLKLVNIGKNALTVLLANRSTTSTIAIFFIDKRNNNCSSGSHRAITKEKPLPYLWLKTLNWENQTQKVTKHIGPQQ